MPIPALQTGVYNGWIMFPSGYVNFKLYEPSKYYTEIGFGAITWHGLTINQARWSKLPKDVQDIILEVAKEYEAKTGTVNKDNYPKQIDELKAKGADRAHAAATRSRRTGRSRSPPGRRRWPRISTPRVCRGRKCWRSRCRRRSRTATNGRSAIT